MSDKIFTEGMLVKRHKRAPDFLICSLSFKIDEFVSFLRNNEKNGWVNVDIKESKGGKLYGELDTWEPKQEATDDDIGF